MSATNTSRRNSLLASVLSIFKAIPDDQLEDLADSLNADSRPGADLFNSRLRHGNPDERQNPTGSPEAASGSGAVRMVGAYSDTTGQSALVQQYQQMAAELAEAKSRITDLEKGLSATATAFASLLGMSKNARVGKASDDDAPGPVERTGNDAEDENQEDGDLEKSIRTISIADMMAQIAGKARETTVSPPNLAMMKSQVQSADALLNRADISVEAANDIMTLKARMRAFQAGHITARQVYAGLDWLPDELKVSL